MEDKRFGRKDIKERFESLYTKGEDNECWIWNGSVTLDGYGQFNIGDRTPRSTHRLAYQFYKGEIKKGLRVCHTCDNRKCVNPNHLFTASQQRNLDDASIKGRMTGGKPLDILSTEDEKLIEKRRKYQREYQKRRYHEDRNK